MQTLFAQVAYAHSSTKTAMTEETRYFNDSKSSDSTNFRLNLVAFAGALDGSNAVTPAVWLSDLQPTGTPPVTFQHQPNSMPESTSTRGPARDSFVQPAPAGDLRIQSIDPRILQFSLKYTF